MSESKKYWYIKLRENFFDSDEITILESMEKGYIFSNILLKLYLRSLRDNGRLMFNNVIPYSPKMIATITRHEEENVVAALDIFQKLGLVEIMDSGAIYMANIQQFIGKSSDEADRMRKYRLRMENESSLQMSEQMLNEHRNKRNNKSDGHIEIKLELDKKKATAFSSEPETASEAVVTLPLNDGSEYPFFQSDVDEFQSLYPAVDVLQAMRSMRGWCLGNPAKRKTRRGVKRFVNSWLSREQDRGGSRPYRAASSDRRTIPSAADYADLED